jgi:capsular polysaccharide transport system permease protein
MATEALRSPFSVTLSVWRALLLRESLARLFGRRAAWFWLLFEPVFHVLYLMLLFATVRVRHVGGIATPLWLMVGVLAWFMFQRTARQAASAVNANSALFAYRQVKPVDAVIARAILEGSLMLVVACVLLLGAAVLGLEAAPADPLRVLVAWLGMWICGLGLGLITSVVAELSTELGKVLGMVTRPLYLLSGVIFPIDRIPLPYRDWLLVNPLLHAVESTRSGFATYYHAVPGVSIAYLYACAISLLLIGLMLHVALARRLVMQ